MLTIILAIVTGACTLIAVLISYLAYRETHSERIANKSKSTLKTAIREGVSDLVQQVTLIDNRLTSLKEDFSGNVQAIVEKNLRPVDIRVAQIETKVDLFKEQLALAMAQLLHQPDPARYHIDSLLESFMEGTITPDERSELREHLAVITQWEPGQPSPFPIHPGEQVAAAILLNTMDTALALRGRHSSHD